MPAMQTGRTWDVFCRVIDNHGDVGVAWRFCADLAARGERVRFWLDDAAALTWMAPRGHPGVEVVAWTEPAPDLTPGDIVVETFGCDPPHRFVQHLAAREKPTPWINLEYLSAEAYVERSHGLPSPIRLADGRMLVRRFFYPGFTSRTGGLLREPGLMAARQAFDRAGWLSAHGFELQPGQRVVSLFCYDNPALPALIEHLAEAPTLLLATPGAPAAQLRAMLGPLLRRGALDVRLLPWLSQPDYDRLLWACDLNFVRGEDSFVRAQWAGKPFVWQIYPQRGGVHGAKLHAFLDRLLADADAGLAVPLRRLWLDWNGLGAPTYAWPDDARWLNLCERWRDDLLAHADLVTQLLGWVDEAR